MVGGNWWGITRRMAIWKELLCLWICKYVVILVTGSNWLHVARAQEEGHIDKIVMLRY